MAYDGEGKIYIPIEEFWEFVSKYQPVPGAGFSTYFSAYGVPKFTDNDVEISYAFSTETAPEEWAAEPKAVTEWKELKKAEKKAEEGKKC